MFMRNNLNLFLLGRNWLPPTRLHLNQQTFRLLSSVELQIGLLLSRLARLFYALLGKVRTCVSFRHCFMPAHLELFVFFTDDLLILKRRVERVSAKTRTNSLRVTTHTAVVNISALLSTFTLC